MTKYPVLITQPEVTIIAPCRLIGYSNFIKIKSTSSLPVVYLTILIKLALACCVCELVELRHGLTIYTCICLSLSSHPPPPPPAVQQQMHSPDLQTCPWNSEEQKPPQIPVARQMDTKNLFPRGVLVNDEQPILKSA